MTAAALAKTRATGWCGAGRGVRCGVSAQMHTHTALRVSAPHAAQRTRVSTAKQLSERGAGVAAYTAGGVRQICVQHAAYLPQSIGGGHGCRARRDEVVCCGIARLELLQRSVRCKRRHQSVAHKRGAYPNIAAVQLSQVRVARQCVH